MLIRDDILANFHQYYIFNVMKTSQQFYDQQLFEFCLEHLQSQNFEQLRYHRNELLQLNRVLFKLIIKVHGRYKDETGRGLSYKQINELLRQFCVIHDEPIDTHHQMKCQLFNVPSLTALEYKEIFLQEFKQQMLNESQDFEIDRLRKPNKIITVISLDQQIADRQYQLSYTSKYSKKSSGFQNSKKILKTKNDLKIQMEITYYKKKIRQLFQQNNSLQSDIQVLNQITNKNQKLQLQTFNQMEMLKIDLSVKIKNQQYYLKTINKCEIKLTNIQKQLDQKTEQINKMIQRQQKQNISVSKSQKKIQIKEIKDDFIVQSQYLPANLVLQILSSSNAVDKNQNNIKASEQVLTKESQRQRLNFLQKSNILNEEDKQIVNKCISGVIAQNQKALSLIYRRSQSQKQLGTYMDIRNKQALLILMKTETGQKIGGYVFQKLPHIKCKQVENKNAVIFRIDKNKRMEIKAESVKQAIISSQKHLISFGNDFMIAKNCIKEKNYCFWPRSYKANQFMKDKNPNLFTESNQFIIEQLQIYEAITTQI